MARQSSAVSSAETESPSPAATSVGAAIRPGWEGLKFGWLCHMTRKRA
jgi:hypothetical protein